MEAIRLFLVAGVETSLRPHLLSPTSSAPMPQAGQRLLLLRHLPTHCRAALYISHHALSTASQQRPYQRCSHDVSKRQDEKLLTFDAGGAT